ncbi:hypothetical protein A0H81_07526 [Grifola frondosa]|uniref:Uncharacterized protein n=1 Tax=Grifola frondosa TaxID=5627 RepID=A0A1C7MBG8_GRIFR|nr:hypothetical protein A0H81_07526 [Grifola frondosa]
MDWGSGVLWSTGSMHPESFADDNVPSALLGDDCCRLASCLASLFHLYIDKTGEKFAILMTQFQGLRVQWFVPLEPP